jgi:inner membrane transporter RhtA
VAADPIHRRAAAAALGARGRRRVTRITVRGRLDRRGYDRLRMDSPRERAREEGLLARTPSGALVLGGIASVQFGAALATTLFDTAGPSGTALLRLAFGSLVLLAVWRPRLTGRSRQELRLAALFGLVLAAMNLCFYGAIDRIPLGIAVALEFVGPLTVALLGSRRRLDLLWVALAAIGILALTRHGPGGLDALGAALALVAGALWGTYILVNARLGRVFEGGTGLALAMCVGTVAAAPIGLVEGAGELLSGEVLLLGAAVGVLSSAIPYSFEVEALRRIRPAVFGVLMSLEPAVAALAGLVVLGQHLGGRVLLGIALVTVASVGAARSGREAAVTL